MIPVRQRKVLLLAASLGAAWPGAGGPARAGDRDPVVFRERGDASVYGDELQGRRTASGARFDQREPMAAHPELPLGSGATVTNPDIGEKVEVEIVDRGPHAKERDLDLSESAVRRLGIAKEIREEGDAEVLIEATRDQVEEAIDTPGDERKVEKQLGEARRETAKDGTPQPRVAIDLEPPQGSAAER
jgi:rare lipoprotein A